ncbi:MinD/ParA family ATP-binding protein [Cupriavidus respiraculi]|nr:AAA family ATPase [Cupriavidus respiraculi]
MSTLASDQAESLRRMLAPRTTRRIAVVACEPGAGATTVALGLSNALALQGERVLLVDEDAARSRATRLAGANPRGTLAQVLTGSASAADATGDRAQGAPAVLPGDPQAWGDLGALGEFRSVLCDARSGPDGMLSRFGGSAHNLVVVTRAEPASITAAYACIKRLHHLYACRHFHLVVNAADNDNTVATAARNLARTASQYLGVQAVFAGALPFDPLIARSTALGRCVVEAFPGAAATASLRRIAAGIAAWPLKPETDSNRAAPFVPPAAALAC